MSRNRSKYPALPSVILYDDTGNQTFTNGGEFHTWDSIDTKTTHFDYEIDDDSIFLNNNQYGWYEITFECSYVTYEDDNIAVTSQLYVNGSAIAGAKVTCSVAGTSEQTPTILNCQSLHFLVYLTGRDYVQIKTTTDNAGDTYSIAETSRLMIKFIPVKGWNNNAGGNINVSYKGGRFF